MRLVLGSASPRRKEILRYFSLPFEQAVPSFDEEAVPYHGDPKGYVSKLSNGKSASLANIYPDAYLLTADTIVLCDGKLYGKPRNRVEAFQMISELAGKKHTVYTAVTLRKHHEHHTHIEETEVEFHPLTAAQINHYLDRIDSSDKAAGYAIQSVGGVIVRRIDGCFFNVMGLPVEGLVQLFRKFGLDIWNFLK